MRRYCNVIQCENNRGFTDSRIILFSSGQDKKNQWKEALNELGLQHAGGYVKISVCMLHFHPDDILKTGGKSRLRPGAVPSLRTRPFDPLWQTSDGPPVEIETVKCEPNTEIDESMASMSYSNSNEHQQVTDDTVKEGFGLSVQIMECTDNDDVMLENQETMTKSNSITEHPESSRSCLNSDDETQKSRTLSKSKSLHSVQKSPEKLCEICLTTLTTKEFKQHLCQNETIPCEYCTDEIFITTFELRKHLSNAHENLTFYKCTKCTLAFPMRRLLEIHENIKKCHLDDESSDSSDFDESPMENLYGCQFCGISMSDPKDLGSHMRYHHSLWYQKQQQQQLSNVSEQVDSVEGQTKMLANPKKYCKIFSCEFNRGTDNERLLLFCARDSEVNEKWRKALKKLRLNHPRTGLLYICMLHFHPNDIEIGNRWTLRPGAVPSIKSSITLEEFFESIADQSDGQKQGSSSTSTDNTQQSKQKCSICCTLLKTNVLLESHFCDDDETREISCEYCDESFQSIEKCVQHLDTVHADGRTMYQCRKCTRHFGMMRLKELHEKYHPHPNKPYQCDICVLKFSTKYKIKKHLENVHAGKLKPSFLCSECGRSFMTKRSLENHTLLHGEPTIQCPDCPAKFHQQLTFDIHYQWHKNLTFKCNECEYTCTKLRTLRAHISFIHVKKPRSKLHKCPFCHLKCTKVTDLKTHLRTHTGEKPFECEICHNFYRYRGDLNKHKQTHLGENIYKCDVCEQRFRYHLDFKRHSFEHYKEDKEKGSEPSAQISNDTEQMN